ncbi:uncharacterized protein GGS22DRAFT_184201 [Annulohypoxylon maeteangense]|uniref:uncharacterized protein n=1 Tax=Annulohypoxylon maeteangense TaxID=1927788 RepID=UPI002007AC28|nr:uncharacterized protein GGS22DRAFT_184201 [Annulohypoxylon maeteangense]KAI0888623.1 hypothetical protein GGS22DRAFT_184201 [Annulohypoxylon maeteangense]
MDRGDSVIIDVLQGIVPEQTLELLQAHLQNPSTTLQAVWRHSSAIANKLGTVLSPLFGPILARALQALHDSPDVVVLGFVLGTIVLMLQIVVWVHRTMMYMTRLAFRMMGWALVFALVAVVWRRGPEATIRDVVVFVGKMAGYAALVKDIWLSEYKKFDAQTKRGGDFSTGPRAPSGGYTRSRNNGW